MKKISAMIAWSFLSVGLLFFIACKEQSENGADEASIKKMFTEFSVAVAARDIKKIMAIYADDPDLVAYDAFVPREYKGAKDYQKAYESFFAAYPGPVKSSVTDLKIKVSGNLAYATCIDQWSATDSAGKTSEVVMRCTDVLEKREGKWQIVHEHISFPADPTTGMADFLSKK